MENLYPHPNPLNGNGNGHLPFQLVPIPLMQTPEAPDDEWDLRQLLAVLRRRVVVIAGVAIAVGSVVAASTLTQTPKYEGKFKILVESVTAEAELAELTSNLRRTSNLDYETQIQVLQSPELMGPIVAQLQTQYPTISYGSLLKDLSILRLKDTKILEVRYQNSDPQMIQFVLQQLAQSYLRYSLDERQTNLRQGMQFVEEQLPELRRRVDQLQEQLQAFRQQYDFIAPENRAQQLTSQKSALAQKRLDLNQELAITQSRLEQLEQETGRIAILKSAAIYQQIVSEIRDLEAKIAEESTRFTDENLAMQVLQEQRENLIPVLSDEAQRVLVLETAAAQTALQTLAARSQTLAQAEAQLSQQVEQLSALARQYTDLQRELQVATDSLNRFLATRENLQIEEAQTEIPWQLIQAPVQPQQPISPNIPRGLLLGAAAGVLLGIASALLIEKLDNVFHSPSELKEKTKLPLLGVIPFHKQLQEVQKRSPYKKMADFLSRDIPEFIPSPQHPPNAYGGSSFLESFRSLHANIRFLGSDAPVRSLTISSALPGDGKSTIAIQLAQAAAAMGQRVLLVDADLRRPQIHHRLGLSNLRGLSNLISTRLPLRQVIQAVPASGDLFAITAGQIPPDPTKLLSSRKMQHLVERVQKVFDLVIYDTPPLVGLADASLLAAHMDGIILVVGLGKTDCSALMQALDRLKVAQTPVLGTVVNGLKQSAAANSYGYNYYYYRDKENPIHAANRANNGAVANGDPI